ncbi:MAG TPA: thioredoxin domain-containing protein [Candidatus Angelobacter sp.]|nr:thioredoxin domain-containing protein [Candidatus Angelobacter sp.]
MAFIIRLVILILPGMFLLPVTLIKAQTAGADSSPQAEMNRRIERQVRAYAEAPPDAQLTLGKLTPSGFTGYDNLPVTIEQKGSSKTFNFLLSKDGKKLLYVKEFDLTEDPYKRVMDKIDLSGRPIRGAEKAAVTMVVYDDYQCPFCARMYVDLVNQVMNGYQNYVRIIVKDFPIVEAHPWAMRAAIDSQCLARQNSAAYWDFSDYVHTHQQEVNTRFKEHTGDMPYALDTLAAEIGQRHGANAAELQACLARQDKTPVEASMAEARSLGVSATPTMFVNGEEVEGVLSAAALKLLIDRAIKESFAK